MHTETRQNLASPDFKSSTVEASRFEQTCTLALLIVFCSIPFLVNDQAASLISVKEMGLTSPQGDFAKQLILMGIYGSVVLLLWPRLPRSTLGAVGWPLLLLLVWIFASASWSTLPDVTVRRAIALTGTMIVGLYLALRWPPIRLAELFNLLTIVVLALSLGVAVLLPSSGLDLEGRLRGVFSHKNLIASFAALGTICAAASLLAADACRQRAWIRWSALALSVLTLALAHSATPIPGIALACWVMWLLHRQPVTKTHRLSSFVCALLLLAMLIVPWIAEDLGALATMFGRDTNFSGRTQVWAFSHEFIERSVLLGYGYSSFWQGGAGLLFFRWAHFPVPHAHNGSLQLLLDCGAIGLTMFLGVFVSTLTRLFALLNSIGRSEVAWIAGYLVLYICSNVTETRLLEPNDLYTTFFVYSIVQMNVIRVKKRMAGPLSASLPTTHTVATF